MAEKILILTANPKNTLRLRLDEEAREIDEGLRRSRKRDQFLLGSRWAVRTDDLRRALLDEEPQFVHFCGHGSGEEGIFLEDELGNSQAVKSEALGNLFKLFSNHVECVILNACYSEAQAEIISQYIRYVVGMKQAISDKAAIKFTTGFYDAIGAGRTIEEAFEFGKNAIGLDSLPGELIPILKKKPTLMREEKASKQAQSSDNIKVNLSVEGEISKKDVALGAASMFTLKKLMEESPDMANAFKLATSNGQFSTLAAKVLATDDVSNIVTQFANSDDFVRAMGNSPTQVGQLLGRIGQPIGRLILKKGHEGSETFDITNIEAELKEVLAESEEFFEGFLFENILCDVIENFDSVTDAASETGGDVVDAVSEFIGNLFS
ncbi:hypothetical protein NIES4101_27880 (plasmid) [Calothrix sp. NIES-4101]|nr:hypothetical protein NIES4101_27880 [Calothrix sp. NIES-4101]